MKIKENINKETLFYYFILIVMGIIYICKSNGFYFIDEGEHFINNRYFFFSPDSALGAWSRLGRVILYAPIAYFGHYAAMSFAFLIFLGTLHFSKKISEILTGEDAAPVIFLIGMQPVLFDLSFTVMSELPAAFLMVFSLFLYLKGKYTFSMLAATSIFLFRSEMYVFCGFLAILFIMDKRYKQLPLIILGPLLWWFYCFIIKDNPYYFFGEFRKFSKMPKYKEGTEWYHYIVHTPEAFSIVITFLFITGSIFINKIKNKKAAYLIFFTIFSVYFLDTLASWKYYHLSGSIGDIRYLAPISPFVGILAFFGYSKIKKYLKNYNIFKNINSGYLLSLIIFIPVLLILTKNVKPHTETNYNRKIKEFTLEAFNYDNKTHIYSNSWVSFYTLNTPYENLNRISRYNMDTIRKVDEGLFIFDINSCTGVLSDRPINIDSLKTCPNVVFLDSAYVYKERFYLFKKIK